ncbi:hypothetical protein CEXT_422061 [Caerostris extrusa]|uniref:Uncharacterized protein n=1 Tax=Caerostris extrusa TaxID=172846 RepID=A0AAV4Q9C9_CAEEX|nr:hypothetical protein CEXT_422061 [Caerostris extrusa]
MNFLQTKSSTNFSEARASVNSSQLTTDSTANELERVLLDALIAETIENEIIIDTDTMDILNNNLKMGLKSYLYSKDDTSTSSLHDTTNSEMTSTIKDNYHEMIANIDSKQTETEANFYTTIPENHQSDTESILKQSDHTLTVTEKANHHRSNRILSEESEHRKDVDSFPKNLNSQKAYNKEDKYLLINSVVDSVLEKVRKEMDRKKMALSSTGKTAVPKI